ncbi:putative HTH-type transcriptional regulator MurR [uncultured Eubacteriales bacterium]|uniref:Putative HTH-type transcriptional regulator MurR n=1 Tax=uncultured Eubacteriales bacterium TaxID=172733 RepID=A0A212KBP5_9FIRM|nr:putative HTH-type transcriptional regulator MurR [uncultured Eubacteriales bacterium]
MEFLKNLSMRYNALTKQSKRLADFIRENPAQAIKMTAKTLGEESGTSAAAVVRLCQQLGYNGFEQLKISIAKTVSDEELSAPIDPIISRGDSVSDIAQKLCHIQANAVQETLALMDYDDVKKVVSLLQKARVVYLFGVGSSGLVAQELCHRLNRIGRACIFLPDGHTSLEYAAVAEERDLLIGFSYSGETKEVYLAAEHASKRGVPVIAVTRNKESSLSAAASIVLNVPVTEKRVRVGAVSSITSQMFVVDVLYMGLIQKDFEKYEHMFVDTSRIANLLRE